MSHERRGETDEWYTPKYIFDELNCLFDMDVSSPRGGPLHTPCLAYLDEDDDGLTHEWKGFVWMNPPFGHQKQKMQWLRRFFDHGDGIALVPDRTSAPWWQEFAPMSSMALFMSPKVKFVREDGTLGESPSTGTCLLAAGGRARDVLIKSKSLGVCFKPQ